jgi:uncharacterized SAM-binding protein YcdF (DUF218 family)
MSLYQIVKGLALPPADLIVALVIAVLISLRWRRTGLVLTALITIAFYVLATPFFADRLLSAVATVPPLAADNDLRDAQAIVVLSAGAVPGGPEYDGVMIDHTTLERLRYAAHVYRRKALPVLVSGGNQPGLRMPLAQAMKLALEEDFAVPVKWVEDKSADTIENARFSSAILKDAGIHTIVLVTSAPHMPRAQDLFVATGLTVIPAPTGFASYVRYAPATLIPRMAALDESESAIYEILAHSWHGLDDK